MPLCALCARYVLPVLGEDVLWPHTEFDADNKRVAKWVKKEEVKKFQNAVKESRLTAWKQARDLPAIRAPIWAELGPACLASSPPSSRATWQAGSAHLATRTSLCTKLAHLEAFLNDSPQLLCTRMPQLLTALKLAQDEVAWWAAHTDAVPDELPKKEKETADFSTFNTATVQTLLRYMMALRHLVAQETARLSEEAAERLQDEVRMKLDVISL